MCHCEKRQFYSRKWAFECCTRCVLHGPAYQTWRDRSKDHRKMSSLAVDLVFKNFPRKHKEREFLAMIVMAHRYNEKLGKAFPKRKTFAGDVGCSDRHAKRLLRSLRSESDIFPIEQGGKGPGSVTCYGLNPKYLADLKGTHASPPYIRKKGDIALSEKGDIARSEKGDTLPR
jgi:hypothetical protein